MFHLINWIKQNKIGAIIVGVFTFATMILIISLAQQNQLTTRPDQVPLRTGPGLNYKQITKLKAGTKLTVVAKNNGWWQVKRDNNQKVGWVASWVANNTKLKTATQLSEATIVLDPGHGGSDTGAISTDGKHYEKTYTLKTALATEKVLTDAGARVIMVRTKDVVVPLLYIPRKAEKYNADAQISFHFDSSESNNSASGVSQYYYNDNSQSLAQALNGSLNNLPLENRGYETMPYLVIKDVTRPAVLLENGFINSDHDFSYIRQSSYQQKIARDVKSGFVAYLNNLYPNNNGQ
ncbi:N-acetylmuramoyl-L-alanine amidase [Fructobacillus tropaeoli]|uniref:N-acetylmuramoyl-L-alanine amidase n=1 Tax=Fructobacillus tropaeoli TaxID=709323 RepID=UPI001944DD20|nr:N-acetylmuramoyl-L-alanine amidase [Fructobacillus tropaeoli]GIC69495.1 N-acetylmuramoyl-L-alanine amidase [Fructobacillus tropaeoli]